MLTLASKDEERFWRECYIAFVRRGAGEPTTSTDRSLLHYRKRLRPYQEAQVVLGKCDEGEFVSTTDRFPEPLDHKPTLDEVMCIADQPVGGECWHPDYVDVLLAEVKRLEAAVLKARYNPERAPSMAG